MNIFLKIKKYIADLIKNKSTPGLLSIPVKNPKKQKQYDLDFYNEKKLLNEMAFYEYKYTINSEELIKLCQEISSLENFYKGDKKEILKKIYNDVVHLNKTLEPLLLLPIQYGIDLIGGSVRDYILNKHDKINDLDILITIKSTNKANKDSLTKEYLITENWCSEEELKQVVFSNEEPIYSKHNRLVQLCLNRQHDLLLSKIFSRDDRFITGDEYGADILKVLSGIMKISSSELNYPLDILLTDQSNQKFIETIDFNICKSAICFISLDKEANNLKFPQFEDLSKRFYTKISFFDDIYNKKITFNSYDKTNEQIYYSFEKNLPKLINKYPDYQPTIGNKDLRNLDVVEKAFLKFNLEKSLLTQGVIKKPKI